VLHSPLCEIHQTRQSRFGGTSYTSLKMLLYSLVLIDATVPLFNLFGTVEDELCDAGILFEFDAVGVVDDEETATSALVPGVPNRGFHSSGVAEYCASTSGYGNDV